MSWIASGAAVQVLNSVGDYPFPAAALPLTSTTTIRIDLDGTSSLRLFLNGTGQFQQAAAFLSGGAITFITTALNRSYTPSLWTDRDTSPTQRIWYINSTSLPFQVDVGSTDQLYETNIPREFAAEPRTYCLLTDLDGATWDIRSGDMVVTYKDPCVLALPDAAGGGWLMVMARYLSDSGGSTPNNSFAQIVAWWSDTSDFRGANTVGPFLLVDGANAWSEGYYARLWLGTPGAVVVQRDGGDGYDLYVYYSVDETSMGYNLMVPGLRAGVHDPVRYSDYAAALSDMNFKAGIACRRVSLSAFVRALDLDIASPKPGPSPYPFTDPDDWEPTSALAGTLLGEVKLSFPLGTRSSVWHSTRDFFTDYPVGVRFADPAPTTCEEGATSFSLYLAANMNGYVRLSFATASALGSGLGLWRGRSMPDSTLVIQGGARWLTTLGKEFLCENQPNDGTSLRVSPDHVVESGEYTSDNYSLRLAGVVGAADHVWLDPDPVQLADGSWCVLGGASVRGLGGDFSYFTGTETDGCADAQSLLDGSVVTLPVPKGRLPVEPEIPDDSS